MATAQESSPISPPTPGTSANETKEELTYGYMDSIKLYFSSKPMKFYEDKLLSYLPFYPEPYKNKRSQIINTVIDSDKNFIHEFYVENTDKPVGKPIDIVLVHGYGAALGFFYKNMEGLSEIPGVRIHAIDMLGFGLSSRPNFPNLKNSAMDDVLKSEAFFIDGIEKWRRARGLENFVLMGHSLGGYLSCAYYMKYGRDCVQKLVLISPVGIERNDFSFFNEKNGGVAHEESIEKDLKIAESQGIDLSNELDDHDRGSQEEPEQVADEDVSDNVSIFSDVNDNLEANERMYQVRKAPQLRKMFIRLWESNCSPFQILRLMGPISSKYISKWTFNRFGRIENPDELLDISNYTSKILLAKGSGEFGLTRILAPGALARLPMSERIPSQIKIKSLWLYGDVDWMSKEGGYQIVKEINKLNKDNDSVKAKFRIIKNAGHHLYVDNAPDFEYQVLKFIQS